MNSLRIVTMRLLVPMMHVFSLLLTVDTIVNGLGLQIVPVQIFVSLDIVTILLVVEELI